MTKVIAPSMRVCAIYARGGAFERLRATRLLDDLFVSAPLQQTALKLLTSPAWPKHLRRVCRALELRRDAMVDAIHEFLPGIKLPFLPRGGLHLWVRLPNQIDEAGLVQRAIHAGVIVIRGRNWFPADAPGPHLSLTYAAERGEVLVAEGSRPSGLLLVVRGAAEVMVTQRGSTRRVRLAVPGRFVGHTASSMTSPAPW